AHATSALYTLSLHDALPILVGAEADVVDAGDLDDVFDVVHDVVDAAARDRVVALPLLQRRLVLLVVGVLLAQLALDLVHLGPQPGRLRQDEAGEEVDHDHAAV